MKFFDIPELKWLALSVFVTTLLLKIWISMDDIVGLALIGAGLTIFVYALVLDIKSIEQPRVIWDEQRGFMAIIRPWRVEICAARLLGSVPLGIDLVSRIEHLSKLIMADVMILESAMRAAYPHLPVERAEKGDILMVNTGGIETSV